MFKDVDFNPKPMIAFLIKYRYAQFIDDNYLVLENKPQYSIEMLYCLWVMLDKIKTPDITESMEIKSASLADNGANLCFINNNVIDYVTFVNKANIAKVSLLQDTFYATTGTTPGKESDTKRLYTFVVTDDETMDMLSDMNLTIPYLVAYVQGELTDAENKPIITYGTFS